jgi:hypothetical protein
MWRRREKAVRIHIENLARRTAGSQPNLTVLRDVAAIDCLNPARHRTVGSQLELLSGIVPVGQAQPSQR